MASESLDVTDFMETTSVETAVEAAAGVSESHSVPAGHTNEHVETLSISTGGSVRAGRFLPSRESRWELHVSSARLLTLTCWCRHADILHDSVYVFWHQAGSQVRLHQALL